MTFPTILKHVTVAALPQQGHCPVATLNDLYSTQHLLLLQRQRQENSSGGKL